MKENDNIQNENENNDEITMIYDIYSCKSTKLKIFGEEFVNNNEDNCSIILEGEEKELEEYIYLPFNKRERKLKMKVEIKLKGINNINNLSSLFSCCNKLISLPDIHKWNTNKITNMS